jgi:inorganic pyrophosphatase
MVSAVSRILSARWKTNLPMPYRKLPIGDNAPEEVNAVVEIPRGSSNKYEYDSDLGVFKLDRPLYSPLFYPSRAR